MLLVLEGRHFRRSGSAYLSTFVDFVSAFGVVKRIYACALLPLSLRLNEASVRNGMQEEDTFLL